MLQRETAGKVAVPEHVHCPAGRSHDKHLLKGYSHLDTIVSYPCVMKYEAPEIIKSDQGRQFISKECTAACGAYPEMKVSTGWRGICNLGPNR